MRCVTVDSFTSTPRRFWPRPSGRVRRRLFVASSLALAVVWAFWQGAHEHGAPRQADLSAVTVDRQFTVDASTGVLDLASVAVQPGEVVEFLLAGSAGSPHRFVLTGAGGAELDTLTAANGDTIIRLRVPESGDLAFFCAVPGHEGLHGNLVIEPGR